MTTHRATEGDHARWQIRDLKAPDLSNVSEHDLSDGIVWALLWIMWLPVAGRALKPAPPPPVEEEEPISLFRAMMSFFERYADLQVSHVMIMWSSRDHVILVVIVWCYTVVDFIGSTWCCKEDHLDRVSISALMAWCLLMSAMLWEWDCVL